MNNIAGDIPAIASNESAFSSENDKQRTQFSSFFKFELLLAI